MSKGAGAAAAAVAIGAVVLGGVALAASKRRNRPSAGAPEGAEPVVDQLDVMVDAALARRNPAEMRALAQQIRAQYPEREGLADRLEAEARAADRGQQVDQLTSMTRAALGTGDLAQLAQYRQWFVEQGHDDSRPDLLQEIDARMAAMSPGAPVQRRQEPAPVPAQPAAATPVARVTEALPQFGPLPAQHPAAPAQPAAPQNVSPPAQPTVPPQLPQVAPEDDSDDARPLPPQNPVAVAEQAADTTGSAALASTLIARQSQPGWKGAHQPLVRAWQEAVGGLKVDGLFGPLSAARLARYVARLPRIRYWPRGATRADVTRWKAEMNEAINAIADDVQRESLRVSIAAENGEGLQATPSAIPAATLQAEQDTILATVEALIGGNSNVA